MSLGQVPFAGGLGLGCLWWPLGLFGADGGHGTEVELTKVKKTRFNVRRRAIEVRDFEAIAEGHE